MYHEKRLESHVYEHLFIIMVEGLIPQNCVPAKTLPHKISLYNHPISTTAIAVASLQGNNARIDINMSDQDVIHDKKLKKNCPK